MRVVYRGNFGVDFSTESHVSKSLEALHHDVVRHQEDRVPWGATLEACREADLFLWTSTYSMANEWPRVDAREAVRTLNAMLPTAALHLDLFWGLPRSSQVVTEPWFKLRYVFTADGDHDEEFRLAGVNHHWLMPAVYHAECFPGTARKELSSDIAFVGNWHSGYHPEYEGRYKLVEFLRSTYGERCAFWPKLGEHAVRGRQLNDLYASVKVVVGDSCFANTSKRYTSDRVFETVGRGGFLLFPRIACVEAALNDGEHLRFYTPGDFAELKDTIDWWVAAEDKDRLDIQHAGQDHVRERHTYMNRLADLIATVRLDAR